MFLLSEQLLTQNSAVLVIFSQFFLILLRIFNGLCAIFVFNFTNVLVHFVSTTLTAFNRRCRCVFCCSMLTTRLLIVVVVFNFIVDSLSITVFYFELEAYVRALALAENVTQRRDVTRSASATFSPANTCVNADYDYEDGDV